MSLSLAGEIAFALRQLLAYRNANSTSTPDELWLFYNTNVRASLRQKPALWIAARVASAARQQVADACFLLAISRLEFNRAPVAQTLDEELFLWELATALVPREFHQERWQYPAGFSSPLHRKADLYRRAARTDEAALHCFVDFFCSDEELAFDAGNVSFLDLLQQGASIGPDTKLKELRNRLRWCLQLRLRARRETPLWVATSLESRLEPLDFETA